jgi:predicted hotdog family 3-hydroxylacyl-ACP dehydratase
VLLDRRWIAAHIPHAGRMCLLDAVLSWDASHIECRTATHRDAANPLRSHGSLGCACGVEYAAQAIAVHAALLPTPAASGAGYLVGLRGTVLHVARLDDIKADLHVSAERVHGDAAAAVYRFSVHDQARIYLNGRATVLLDATLARASMRAAS